MGLRAERPGAAMSGDKSGRRPRPASARGPLQGAALKTWRKSEPDRLTALASERSEYFRKGPEDRGAVGWLGTCQREHSNDREGHQSGCHDDGERPENKSRGHQLELHNSVAGHPAPTETVR